MLSVDLRLPVEVGLRFAADGRLLLPTRRSGALLVFCNGLGIATGLGAGAGVGGGGASLGGLGGLGADGWDDPRHMIIQGD